MTRIAPLLTLGPVLVALACVAPNEDSNEPSPTRPTAAIDPVESSASAAAVESPPPSVEGWTPETFPLPPGFAPSLPAGTESLRFPPGWRDPRSEEFWSYAFVMRIEEPMPDVPRLDEMLEAYYDGLLASVANGAGRDIGDDPANLEVMRAAPNQVELQMKAIDAFGTFEPIDLRVLVDLVPESDQRTVLRIQVGPQPPEHAIWRSLEAAIGSILAS